MAHSNQTQARSSGHPVFRAANARQRETEFEPNNQGSEDPKLLRGAAENYSPLDSAFLTSNHQGQGAAAGPAVHQCVPSLREPEDGNHAAA